MLSPLSTIGASLAAPLLERTVESVADGLSFIRHLAGGTDASSADAADASEPLLEDAAPSPEQLAAFKRLVAERLTAEGLDAGAPFDLYIDEFGEIAVTDHPDRLFIEHLFSHDDELRAAFFELARQGSPVQYAGDRSEEFSA